MDNNNNVVVDDKNDFNPLSEPNTPKRAAATLLLSNSGNPLLVSNSSASSKSLLSASAKYSNAGSRKKYVRQVTGRHNDTELHLAAQRGDAEAVRHILNVIDAQMVGSVSSADFDAEVAQIRSAIVNDVNELGETALFIASDKGHLDVVIDLLPYASPHLKNNAGFDPLHIAALHGHLGIHACINIYNLHHDSKLQLRSCCKP